MYIFLPYSADNTLVAGESVICPHHQWHRHEHRMLRVWNLCTVKRTNESKFWLYLVHNNKWLNILWLSSCFPSYDHYLYHCLLIREEDPRRQFNEAAGYCDKDVNSVADVDQQEFPHQPCNKFLYLSTTSLWNMMCDVYTFIYVLEVFIFNVISISLSFVGYCLILYLIQCWV